MKKVLIVDDEENIRRLLEIYFNKSGFETYLAKDGRDALQKFDEIKPQLVVLDLMLPFISGEEVAQKIRKKSSVPIIMLTAKAEEDDRIEGLEIGADDYVVKPFSPREVIARAKAVLRRAFPDEKVIKIKDLEIMPKEMKVVKNGKDIFFTLKEFKVLIALAKKAPGIMSRDEIMDQIYDEYDDVVYDRTIDAYVKNIRKKLGDDPKSPKYIDSVYGAGYRMIKDEF
jgi:DNA-binding response OmpR family regulator